MQNLNGGNGEKEKHDDVKAKCRSTWASSNTDSQLLHRVEFNVKKLAADASIHVICRMFLDETVEQNKDLCSYNLM